MELDELSGRITGRLGYIGPTMLRAELRSEARRTNNRYCATAPLDRQKYNAGYIHMEIEAPRPWRAGSNDPDLRCRGSDEVC